MHLNPTLRDMIVRDMQAVISLHTYDTSRPGQTERVHESIVTLAKTIKALVQLDAPKDTTFDDDGVDLNFDPSKVVEQ